MLELKNIVKTYTAGDSVVTALKGINLSFRESEFVSILGHSGCGKTTLLNIIGGLDKYDSGDLKINGRSTKEFKDGDWDTYRNHSIGFVFQSYNLIPHQTVLANVELALTLSGVSKAERRRRAAEALEKVGLGDQLKKKPNQMSGGQMQRVAIARALVNDPDILLADEPTGALDSETSVQIMDILKQISKEKLIIMVTHNPELAELYSNRIIRLVDGTVIDDSNPYDATDEPAQADNKSKKRSMSYMTALALSMNNLMTKKGRTFLTAFAGSIGIIGIALILALSTGINAYIDKVQEDTLSSYPINIQAESLDMTSLMTNLMGISAEGDDGESGEHELDKVYESTVMYDMVNSFNNAETKHNNLSALKKYLESEESGMSEFNASIQYSYHMDMTILTKDPEDDIIVTDIASIMGRRDSSENSGSSGVSNSGSNMSSMMGGFSTIPVWQEMLPGDNGELVSHILMEQYDVIAGHWPTDFNETVLVVDQNNELSDLMLYALGLKNTDDMRDIWIAAMSGENVDPVGATSWTYDEILDKTYRLVLTSDCFVPTVDGTYTNVLDQDLGRKTLFENGTDIKIVGIIRQNEDAVSGMMSGAIGYTTALTDYVIANNNASDLIKAQLADPDTDVISGLPFPDENAPEITDEEKAEDFKAYLETVSTAQKAEMYTAYASRPDEEYVAGVVAQQMATATREGIEQMVIEEAPEYTEMLSSMDDETLFSYFEQMMYAQVAEQYTQQTMASLNELPATQLEMMFDAAEFTVDDYAWLYDEYMPQTISDSTYEDTLKLIGYVDADSPSTINIYASTFADKDGIADIITKYNSSVDEANKISYTDYVALLMSSITTIINAISYVLIAFVAISLVVSSIMIGIITYISVLERTKEIGILRAIGASKRDVSRVFNAETIIVGFGAGAIGIIITLLLCIPINAIIHHLTGIMSMNAQLPAVAAIVLIAISMFLTVIAGLIPSRVAAKKDPVVALRTE